MVKKQKHLIIGVGEVGEALRNVLYNYYFVDTKDKEDLISKKIDIIHICYRYNKNFIKSVKEYQKIYKPKYTIIHSSVPVGTSRKCNAIHSPIIGQHPFLEEGIKTFPKMIGGEKASEVADCFRKAGLKVILFDKQETTESAKLFLTEYYRICIEFTKQVKRYCDKYNLNFHEVYTIPNQIYNYGYEKLGHKEFIHSILQPIMTKIGGHCVMNNKKLIKY